ncbi:MAG: hypothetical protein IPO27_02610 [Bacteroidetes bacterium]|nr:hypothetical protein [Bacteroidota bacterium]
MSRVTVVIYVLIAMCSAKHCLGQGDVYRVYNPEDYPKESFRTQVESHRIKNVEVKLIEVFNNNYFTNKSLYCRAWMHVLLADTIYERLYFDNMNAYRGCSGIYFDKDQPPNFLVFSKFGDYDGRTIIIDTNGTVHNLSGGNYFISRDGRFLFSIYDSDKNGLTVFDFRLVKVAFADDDMFSRIDNWYFQGGKYFSIDQEGDEMLEEETTNPNFLPQFSIQVFDFTKRALKKERLPFENLIEDNRIDIIPRFKTVQQCQCD